MKVSRLITNKKLQLIIFFLIIIFASNLFTELERFIEDFEKYEEERRQYFVISLKYKGKSREPVITTIKRISKPGLRVYSNSDGLPKVLGDLGIAIISTSKGVMTNFKAKELGVGGEVLCYIW